MHRFKKKNFRNMFMLFSLQHWQIKKNIHDIRFMKYPGVPKSDQDQKFRIAYIGIEVTFCFILFWSLLWIFFCRQLNFWWFFWKYFSYVLLGFHIKNYFNMLPYIIHSYNYIVLNLQTFDSILMVQENLNGFFFG